MPYNAKQRREMAKLGQALPDGSYPIKTRKDLENAISLVGLGNAPDKVIKDHIIKRARAIDALSMIPPKWMGSGDMKQGDDLEHFGIKGMHWGVRKDRSTGRAKKPRPVSADHRQAAKTHAKIKKSGLSSVSNKDLKFLNERTQAEKKFSELSRQTSTITRGHETAKTILAIGGTAAGFFALANSPMVKSGVKFISEFMAKSAAAAPAVVKSTALVIR